MIKKIIIKMEIKVKIKILKLKIKIMNNCKNKFKQFQIKFILKLKKR